MNKELFLRNFYIMHDKVASQDAPGYTPEEIGVFATQAQNELLLTYYDSKERMLVGSFEGSEKVKVYLDELVKKSTLTTLDFTNDSSSFNSTSVYCDLPLDCLFQVTEKASNADGEIRIKPVTHDYIEANKDNPYKQPNEWVGEKLIWRVNIDNKRVELISNDTIPTKYDISYIKYPEDINLENDLGEVSELDPITHFELLNITVRIASIATDTELYQIRDKEAESNK